jgi:two-component system, response regulator PdtaR
MSIRILIVEDEPIIAADIESSLLRQDYEVAGIAYSSTQALDMLVNRYPDLVLLDIAIKGDKDGIDIAHIIKEKYRIPFIYLTSFSDRVTLERAKPTMPFGYIVKPFKDKDLLSTIEIGMYRYADAHNAGELKKEIIEQKNEVKLTKMEYHIIKKIWEGKSNKDLSDELFISVNTTKTHIKNIFFKFNVRSRNELIVLLR